MKQLYFYRILTIILLTALLVNTGCDKNELPTCQITNPINGNKIVQGEMAVISVEANDSDGQITEVIFFIDGVVKSSATSIPYIYNWNTTDVTSGNHLIEVHSSDNDGGITSSSITVDIVLGVTANFTSDKTSGLVPLAVAFTDQSKNIPTSWQWDFGDGYNSTERNPIHTYTNDGTYTVSLTVINEYDSDTKTEVNYISVFDSSGTTGTYIDTRDGQTYKTIQIGNQKWMAENLKYLPAVISSGSESYTESYYYVYGYYGNVVAEAKVTSNYISYGVLYNWKAACSSCPSGWHLPSEDEWTELTDYLINNGYGYEGSGEDIGKSMAFTSGWSSSTTPGDVGNEQSTNNSSGFSALPGGIRYGNGSFRGLSFYGIWWSSSGISNFYAWNLSLFSNYGHLYQSSNDREFGYSVRCLKD